MSKSRKKQSHRAGKIICILLIALSLLVVAAITMEYLNPGTFFPVSESVPTPGTDAPTELSLDRAETTLYVTTAQTLTVQPEGTAVQWSSSDPNVATVDENGRIQAAAPGTATITAAAGSLQASCTVTVIPLPEVTTENPTGVNIDSAGLEQLRSLTAKNPLSVSVYYRDLGTGTVIEYNSGRKYQCGSVIKAPYCKWLIASGADLQETLTLQQANILEGGGATAEQPVGTQFTVEQLIEAAITYSDNTAYAMLAARYGFDGFLGYAQSLGVGANQSAGNLFGSMSAVGAGIYFTDIYNWSLQSPELSQNFMGWLKNTSYRRLISEAVDHPVAHKFGYNGGTNGFHDAAIVYSDRPYILTVFTYLNPDSSGTVEYIQNIASCLDGINAKH